MNGGELANMLTDGWAAIQGGRSDRAAEVGRR